MRPSVARIASTLGLAVTLGLTFTPLGCDSTQALPFPASSPSPNGPEVPPSTERAITKCTESGIPGLTKDYHTLIFDVKASKSGSVLEAKVRNSGPSGDGIAGCIKQALLAMHVSPWIVSLGSPAPGEGVSRESRGQMGFAEALGAVVQLVPVLVVAAGVTVIVVVAIYIVSEVATTTTTTTTTTTPDDYDAECMPWLHECLENMTQPSWNRRKFGSKKDCKDCVAECRHKKGTWPDYKCPRLDYRRK